MRSRHRHRCQEDGGATALPMPVMKRKQGGKPVATGTTSIQRGAVAGLHGWR
ncbi:hypothetical protein [Bittarella massiliensis (ex Durand et al. 2017)]|uniref:hypothetical protein n=1 Tax=Bittarella massiliensis (ex Durand et al. 2017) TaxID=1720313 RepID=UPI001AA0C60F|nr:hypothetical protein [Bittarella massiliensis (ex Durand et al. 2017)]MBO1679599.1 hypothetical protein [Bittarella massiliensis (ex Durand et al. 2017)]